MEQIVHVSTLVRIYLKRFSNQYLLITCHLKEDGSRFNFCFYPIEVFIVAVADEPDSLLSKVLYI